MKLNRFHGDLLHRRHPFWLQCLAYFPIAALPSLALLALAEALFIAAGIDPTELRRASMAPTGAKFLSGVVLAPLVETLLLAAGLWLLQLGSKRPLFVAGTSALAWGALHGIPGFFGAVWSFFVFSCAYLAWREESFAKGFLAAAVPHALVNLSVFLRLLAGA